MSIIVSMFEELMLQNELFKAVLSSPFNSDCNRIIIIPFKNQFQISRYYKDKCLHQNVASDQLSLQLEELISQYKQTMLFTAIADYHILTNKKGKMTLTKKPPTHQKPVGDHNRQKKAFFQEGEPFLIELGIMGQNGKVLSKKADKFRQVNRFVEMVSHVVDAFSKEEPIHIVDLGCGKAALTFALYIYLQSLYGGRVSVHGVDQKQSVIDHCQKVAQKLGYKQLTFSQGSIQDYTPTKPVTMVAALHACDTATDDALAKALAWEAQVILAAPCCQHEVAQQIQNIQLRSILKHGILKEKFAAIVTDAARAELLETAGYRTQVLEFIDPEHTPKNILIRAVKAGTKKSPEDYQQMKELLSIQPKLERLL